MMRFDEKSGNFYCTELGRIASHFYIHYSSVETYNEILRQHMNDSEVIDMVAHSSEFENIVVREEEQNELEQMIRTSCPLEVKGGPANKHGKVSILIQLYISRGSIDSFSFISDAAYISASLARFMRALFEICLRRGWCEMSSFMLDYCKAVDHQIWPHQHPLRQFDRDMSSEILRKLEERGADLDRLQEMEEKDIGALIRYAPGGRLVKQYLGYFSSIQLSATVSPITRTVLKVDLLITPDFIWKDRFHGAVLHWWILVERILFTCVLQQSKKNKMSKAIQSLKHQRKWKSDPNYTKSWYDRGAKIYQADKFRKGACENKITMAGVRQLLEEDLELDKNTLYPFKKFISEQVDEVLKSPKVSEPASGVKKKSSEKKILSKASKKLSSEGSSDSLDSKSEEIEDEVKSKKKVAPPKKNQKSEEPRKSKRPAKETKVSSKKRIKLTETSEENSDAEAGGNASEDDQSQSSAEKPVKKKEVATPAYGKRVEHLKSTIKACGMSVPPVVYKRAKQVSENKREAFLIKELEEILSREGLSKDPSEKEIKEVKKRKDRAKELEGIDMSNIVSSTRRRSTTSFVPPPKPKIPVESDGDDAEDTDSSNDDDDAVEDDDADDVEDGDDSQSEELNEDDDEDSD